MTNLSAFSPSSHRRAPRASFRFALCALLALAASPVFADNGSSMAADSATAEPVQAPLSNDAMALPDRALLLASDLNQLFSASQARPEASNVNSRIQGVLKRALALLGTPYRWGGTTTSGFDCSGLVGYVFRTTLGIELPRVSREMANAGQRVERSALAAGDLVFFGRGRGGVDHVGIYIGDGQFVHAPRTGRDVSVSKLDGYWGQRFISARRVAGS